MKLTWIWILIVTSINIIVADSAVTKSDHNIQERNSITTTKPKLATERRKLPMFPKTKRKFFVTPEPVGKNSTMPTVTTTTKRLLMSKILPKNTIVGTKNTTVENRGKKVAVTRPTLMKSIKFTIKPSTASISRQTHDKTRKTTKLNVTNRGKSANINTTKRMTTKTIQKTEMKNPVREMPEIRNLNVMNDEEYFITTESIPNELKKYHRKKRASKVDHGTFHNVNHNSLNHDSSESSSYSEEQTNDRNEFIFVKGEQKRTTSTIQKKYEIYKDVTEDTSVQTKSKRSNNIIEEENLATTVSGFKFTGRDSRLRTNFNFNNINV